MVSIPPGPSRQWQQWTTYLQSLQSKQQQALQMSEQMLSEEHGALVLHTLQKKITAETGLQFFTPGIEFLVGRYKEFEPTCLEGVIYRQISPNADESVRYNLEALLPQYSGQHITFMDLGGQFLKDIGALAECPSLQVCLLARNFLHNIDALVDNCDRLIWLDVHNNQVFFLFFYS